MSVAFILGAGASHGESLKGLPDPPPICKCGVTPPVMREFFDGDFLESIGYDPDSDERDFQSAGGAYMLLFGMCAISERPSGAGPSDRNGQSPWLSNGARGRSDYCDAVLAPPYFTWHTSQEARCMRHPRLGFSQLIQQHLTDFRGKNTQLPLVKLLRRGQEHAN